MLAVAAIGAGALAGCGGGSGSAGGSGSGGGSPSARRIEINGYAFQPQTVQVKAGGTVTWQNREAPGVEHTATAQNGAFDTSGIPDGQSKTIRLTKPGTYVYHCEFHPFMQGKLVVH